MKKFVSIIVAFIACAFIFTACQSNEDKAEKLIKQCFEKSLFDYSSYEPIETNVSVAKNLPINDEFCLNKADSLAKTIKMLHNYAEDINEYSLYSSSYMRAKLLIKIDLYNNTVDNFNRLQDELNEYVSKMDTNQVIGWTVYHSFRCKTYGGYSTIGNYRFIINKDFSEIKLVNDIDDKTYSLAIGALYSAMKGEKTTINRIE